MHLNANISQSADADVETETEADTVRPLERCTEETSMTVKVLMALTTGYLYAGGLSNKQAVRQHMFL